MIYIQQKHPRHSTHLVGGKWVGVLINELDGMFLVLNCSYRLRWFILGMACKSVVYLGDNNTLGW